MKFITFETWTRVGLIEAESVDEAYKRSEPKETPVPGLNLANWLVVPIPEEEEEEKHERRH